MNDYLYEVANRLVAFDTVSAKSDRDAMKYIAAELSPRGFKTAIQPIDLFGVAQANLVAWVGPRRAEGLIISGHVDVVPFDGQPGWERDPLKLELAGERIYGRGTTDMKGFIAQCLDAARTLDSSRLTRPLVFVFTASEEVGCLGAHSVAPARGVNAIAVMARVIDTIGRYQQELAARRPAKYLDIFPDAPCDVLNFGTVHGGIALNMITEECKLRVSYRSLPDADPLSVYHEIERRVAALDGHDYAGREHRAKIELAVMNVVPPLDSPRGTALEAALFAVTGANTSDGALYATDGGWFTG